MVKSVKCSVATILGPVLPRSEADRKCSFATCGNVEISESAPLDEIVSGADGDRIKSELSSPRQSPMDEELNRSVSSEMSEDLSARTAISVSKEAMKITRVEIVLPGQETADPADQSDSPEQSIENTPPGGDGDHQSIETVLMAPLMEQVTAATDDEEITTSNNSSPSSSSAQSMHTAGGGNSITSDQVEMLQTPPTGDSRETTPPDDGDEVLEQLEHEPASPTNTNEMEMLQTPPTCDSRETTPPDAGDEVLEQLEHEPASPTNTNEITFDLAFEPHAENKGFQRRVKSEPRIRKARHLLNQPLSQSYTCHSKYNVYRFRDNTEMLVWPRKRRKPVYAGACELLKESFDVAKMLL